LRHSLLKLAAALFALFKRCAHRGQVVAQACVEQLLSQVGEISLHVNGSRAPGQSQGRRKVGRMHDLKVLLILRGCATGQFIHPLAYVAGAFHRFKVVEGCKKMIVPRLSGGGNKGAHGKGVDQLVIELLIAEGVGGRLAFFATNRLWGKTASGAVGLGKDQGFVVDAEIVACGLTDEGFCIHSARQVSVQIGALRHGLEESV
jgi:hypothetical protein